MGMSAADPLLARFRQLLADKGVSQARLCRLLTERTGELWLDQRMGKLLNGKMKLRVEDLVVMAETAGISLVELTRDPSREYVADLTPSELRLIHAMRDFPAIAMPLMDIVNRLAPPQRKPPRAVLRERMRRARDA